jgi:hypothetical protein
VLQKPGQQRLQPSKVGLPASGPPARISLAATLSLLPPRPASSRASFLLQATNADVQNWLSQGLITDQEAKSFSPTQLEFMARKRGASPSPSPGAHPAAF